MESCSSASGKARSLLDGKLNFSSAVDGTSFPGLPDSPIDWDQRTVRIWLGISSSEMLRHVLLRFHSRTFLFFRMEPGIGHRWRDTRKWMVHRWELDACKKLSSNYHDRFSNSTDFVEKKKLLHDGSDNCDDPLQMVLLPMISSKWRKECENPTSGMTTRLQGQSIIWYLQSKIEATS